MMMVNLEISFLHVFNFWAQFFDGMKSENNQRFFAVIFLIGLCANCWDKCI